MAQRHERICHKARLRFVRIVLDVAVGNLPEIFKGLKVVVGNAIAFGIHAAELPLRHGMSVLGGIFKRDHCLLFFAELEPLGTGTERLSGVGGGRGSRNVRHIDRRPQRCVIGVLRRLDQRRERGRYRSGQGVLTLSAVERHCRRRH